MVDVYRTHLMHRGSSEIKHYESPDGTPPSDFMVDLLRAHLDTEYDAATRPHNWRRLMFASLWRKKLLPDEDSFDTHVKKILKVQKLVDGEWIDLDVRFTKPEVTILDGSEVGPYND